MLINKIVACGSKPQDVTFCDSSIGVQFRQDANVVEGKENEFALRQYYFNGGTSGPFRPDVSSNEALFDILCRYLANLRHGDTF